MTLFISCLFPSYSLEADGRVLLLAGVHRIRSLLFCHPWRASELTPTLSQGPSGPKSWIRGQCTAPSFVLHVRTCSFFPQSIILSHLRISDRTDASSGYGFQESKVKFLIFFYGSTNCRVSDICSIQEHYACSSENRLGKDAELSGLLMGAR